MDAEAEAGIRTKKKRRRLIAAVAAGTVLLSWLLYLFLTSSFFLKTALLPILSQRLGAKVNAQDIYFSPLFGTVEIKFLTLKKSESHIFECRHLSLNGSLLSLPGKIDIGDLNIRGVKVDLKQDAAGRWNLPLLDKLANNSDSKEALKKNSLPFKLPEKVVLPFGLKVSRVDISNIEFHAESAVPDNPFKADISDFSLTLKNLKPSSHTDLTLNAKFSISHRQINISRGVLNSSLRADLNEELMPDKLNFSHSLEIISGKFNQANLAGNKLLVNSELSFNGNKFNIDSLNMGYRNAQNVSSTLNLAASGSLKPLTAKFKLDAPQIPEEIMDIVENLADIHGLGSAEASLLLQVAYKDHVLSSASNLNVKHHTSRKGKSSLPEIYLELEEDITIDFNRKNLDVKRLKIDLKGKSHGDLTVSLSEPFSWNWTAATSYSSVHPVIFLKADNINPSAVNPLTAPHGIVFGTNGSISGIMSTRFDPGKPCIRLTSKFVGSNLDMSAPGYKISAVSTVVKLTASSMDMKNISFSPTVLVQHRGKTVVQVSVSGTLDLPGELLNFHLNVARANRATLDVLPDEVRNLDVMQQLVARLSPFELKVKTNGDLNFKKQMLNIANAEVNVDRPQQGKLKVNFLSPWPIDLSPKGDILPEPMNANVVFHGMDVRFVNMFLPDSQRITSGRIYTSLKTRLDILKEKLDTQGIIKLVSTGFRTGSLDFRDMALSSSVNVSMDNWLKLDIKDFTASVYNRNQVAVNLKNTSNFDFDAGNMTIKTQLKDVTERAVKMIQPDFAVRFKLKGKTVFSMQDNYKRPLVRADLDFTNITSKNLHSPLAAALNIDIYPKYNSLVVNKFQGSIRQQQKRLTDFKINGTIAAPFNAGKSELYLTSNKLDLKLLEKILQDNKAPKKAAVQQPGKPETEQEPAQLNLDANAKIALGLNNITYGPNITASCSESYIYIKKNMVSIAPLNVKLNSSDVTLRGTVDLGVKGGYPYNLSATTKQLHLGPILHAFSENKTKTIRGEVHDASIKLTGKGITRKNLDTNLNGEVRFDVKNLSIPDSLKSIRTIRIILLPVESFAQVLNYLPKLGTASFSKSLNNARNIYNDVNNLHLKKGKVDLQINSGIVNIDKFHFTGDFIQTMDFSGYVPINPDAKMKLVSNLDMYYLAVPLEIDGTFNTPEPNVRKMVTYFLPQNIYNIMRSSPVRSIIKGSYRETESILKQTGKIISDGILGPQSSKQDDSRQKENSDLIEKLLEE